MPSTMATEQQAQDDDVDVVEVDEEEAEDLDQLAAEALEGDAFVSFSERQRD